MPTNLDKLTKVIEDMLSREGLNTDETTRQRHQAAVERKLACICRECRYGRGERPGHRGGA